MSRFRRKKTDMDNGPGEFHQNGAYHRYFEDWAEYETLNAKRKVRIVRIYAGEYHCVDLPPKTWNLLRAALWTVTILGLIFFAIGAVQDTAQNQDPLLAVCQVISIGGYVAMFFALSNLREKMTIYEYKSGPRALKKSGIITAIICTLCFAVTVAGSIAQNSNLHEKAERTSVACFAVSALAPAMVSVVVCRLPIAMKENENVIPDGSVIIRRPGQ